jgi:hypothetical protein
MAHPFHQHRQHVASRSRVQHVLKGYAEGGKVREPMGYDLQEVRSMGAAPARRMPSDTEFHGTSPEPSIGKRIYGPPRTGPVGGADVVQRQGKIYPNSPEGRRSMSRSIDKLDNEYGAYRYKGRSVVDE